MFFSCRVLKFVECVWLRSAVSPWAHIEAFLTLILL